MRKMGLKNVHTGKYDKPIRVCKKKGVDAEHVKNSSCPEHEIDGEINVEIECETDTLCTCLFP